MDEADLADPIIDAERQHGIDVILYRAKEIPLTRDGMRICTRCKDPIPVERLLAEPDAVRCHYCQQAHELKTKRKM